MKIRTKLAHAAALIVAAGISALPAAAYPAESRTAKLHSVTVSYRDLNLAEPEGVAVLRGRLRAAARTVCGAVEREEARMLFARRTCLRQSIAEAVRDTGLEGQPIAGLR